MLQSLKRDPMATFRPRSGGRLVIESEVPHDTFYKPTDAHLVRVFAFRKAQRASAARLAAIEAAEASGWRMFPRPEDPDGLIYGSKQLATGPVTLTIGNYDDAGVFRVSVRLTHVRCYPHHCRGTASAP